MKYFCKLLFFGEKPANYVRNRCRWEREWMFYLWFLFWYTKNFVIIVWLGTRYGLIQYTPIKRL